MSMSILPFSSVFLQGLKLSFYRSFTLAMFIPKYFLFFQIIMNGNVSMISFFACLL